MSAIANDLLTVTQSRIASIQEQTEGIIDDLLTSLPRAEQLSADERRGIVARYTAVLEGNFIYWMTAAYLAVSSPEARSIIIDNLREEVRDCHPAMLRRFATEAKALPTDSDVLDVYGDVLKVRLFLGRLSPVPILATMAFFEGFIQRFMAYLSDLAQRQGSQDMEYTDVHGVCDIAHTDGLYNALQAELALASGSFAQLNPMEGVKLLETVIRVVIAGQPNTIRLGSVNGAGEVYTSGRVECHP
jgi:hypothetical protein